MNSLFYGIDVNDVMKIRGKKGYGVSVAVAKGDALVAYGLTAQME